MFMALVSSRCSVPPGVEPLLLGQLGNPQKIINIVESECLEITSVQTPSKKNCHPGTQGGLSDRHLHVVHSLVDDMH